MTISLVPNQNSIQHPTSTWNSSYLRNNQDGSDQMCNETKTPSKSATSMIGFSLQQPADRWSDTTMTGCGNNHVGRARSCGFTASWSFWFPPCVQTWHREHYLILRSSIWVCSEPLLWRFEVEMDVWPFIMLYGIMLYYYLLLYCMLYVI